MIQAKVGPTWHIMESEYNVSLCWCCSFKWWWGGETLPILQEQVLLQGPLCSRQCHLKKFSSTQLIWKQPPPLFAHWKVSLWLPKGLTWIAVDWLNLIPILLRNLNGFVIPCSYWRQPFDKRLYLLHPKVKRWKSTRKTVREVNSVDLQNCSLSVE